MAAKQKFQAVCAVCFNVHNLYAKGTLVRHGFEIVGRQNGQFDQAWHTGPCGGWEFPHFGISTAGTEWALGQVKSHLAHQEERLAKLATNPPLDWVPGKYEARDGLKRIERNFGDEEDRYAKILDYAPEYKGWKNTTFVLDSYEYLHTQQVKSCKWTIETDKAQIARYEKAIKNWKPKEATPVEAAKKVHSESVWNTAHRNGLLETDLTSDNPEEVDCSSCLRSLESARKAAEKLAKQVERALTLKKGLGRKLLEFAKKSKKDFNFDSDDLRRALDYKVSSEDCSNAAYRLKDVGLLKRNKDWTYSITDAGKAVL